MSSPFTTAPYRIHRYPTRWIDSWTLRNGRRATLRPVLPQDKDAERAFVAALSPASRRNRFHGAVAGLSDGRAGEMTQIDYRRQMGFVVTVQDDADTEIVVGDGRYVLSDDGVSVEFAVVVADAWHGLGLGTRLVAALCDCARDVGARWLFGEVLAGNHDMLGLMERCGFSARPHPSDERLVKVGRSVAMGMPRAMAEALAEPDTFFGGLSQLLGQWIGPRTSRRSAVRG